MYPNSTVQLPPLVQTGFNPGQDQVSRLIGGVRTGYIVMQISAVLTLGGGPGTAILNGGSLASLFNQVVFYENGQPVVQTDARALARTTELLGFAPSGNIRLTDVANGAYNLAETIVIPFAWPLAVNPWETPFVSKDQNWPITVGLKARGNLGPSGTGAGIGTLIDTAGTADISALNVNIVQEFDTDLHIKPVFRPFFDDMVSGPIPGAVSDFIFYADFPDVLRFINIQQDTAFVVASGGGEVSDIITQYQLRTDDSNLGLIDGNGSYLGYQDRVQQLPRQYGGAVEMDAVAKAILAGAVPAAWVNPCYLPRNFQSSGRLSNVLVRNQIGANFRMLINGQNSSSGVAGSSVVRMARQRLQKVDGVTSDRNAFAV
jgi:hypothetical protein